MGKGFDQYASLYDAWFLDNRNVLYSEVNLVVSAIKGAHRILSIGCGSGLFEMIMRDERRINVVDGIEPSEDMARIARLRGMNVVVASAEEASFGNGEYDLLLFNGCSSYITDLDAVVRKAYDALPVGGRIVMVDVPKESSYGMMYNLAKALGTWDHPLLDGVYPPNPYPIELVNIANWRTSAEKAELLEKAGFSDLSFSQTLTAHPLYSNGVEEQPVEGCDRGDYVALTAYKR